MKRAETEPVELHERVSFDDSVLSKFFEHATTVPNPDAIKRRFGKPPNLRQHVVAALEGGQKSFGELLDSAKRTRVGRWWSLSRQLRTMAASGLVGMVEPGLDPKAATWRLLESRSPAAPAPKPPAPPHLRALDGLTREQRRSRRKREVRARTISVKRLTKRELELGRLLYPEDTLPLRPVVRAECRGGRRPCIFVSCRFNLFLDVNPKTGAIKLNFPDLEPDEVGVSCCLDVADRGGTTLEDVGAIMNLTRERIRQVEVKAFARLERAAGPELLEHVIGGERGRRHLPILEATP